MINSAVDNVRKIERDEKSVMHQTFTSHENRIKNETLKNIFQDLNPGYRTKNKFLEDR